MNKSVPRILIVDKEEDILDILSFILKREGFDVTYAFTGQEGLEKIQSESFLGVISELALPKLDGMTLLKTIRAEHNFIPFVFFSGHAKSGDEHELINYGALDLIHKPHIEKIIPAIRKLRGIQKELSDLTQEGSEALEFLEMLHSTNRKAI